MNYIKVLTILSFFLSFNAVFAQQNSTVSDSNSNARLSHSVHLVVVIGILSTMFSLTCLILACAKFCHSNESTAHFALPQILPHSMSRFSGIDKKAIESLPFFRFSSLKGSKEGLECVVCLSKFEDSEILRLLPKCRHAFHVNCIDKWLESHSSCPLCRYKFDVADLTNFTYTSSLRYPQNIEDGLDSNLEIFVQREQENTLRTSFRKFGRSTKEALLIGDRKLLDKFKHKIIVLGIVCKSRWSDVNSSDLMLLNSKMLNDMSSKRFSPFSTSSGRFCNGVSMDDQVVTKVEEDMERKRMYESKVSKITRSSSSVSSSSFPSSSNAEGNQNQIIMSRSLNNSGEKRSMSEITNVSRFTEFSTRNGVRESLYFGNNAKDEKIRRIWLPIARRTVQWFAGRERNSLAS